MTRSEVSSGGVIFKKVGKSFQILLIKDKSNKWTFPKGLIEKGEEKEATAQREIGEEVGLKKIKLTSELKTVKYFYKWQKDIIKKTVHYFLFEFVGDEKPKPQEEEGISEAKWFNLEEIDEILGYPTTNNPVLKKALKIIYEVE